MPRARNPRSPRRRPKRIVWQTMKMEASSERWSRGPRNSRTRRRAPRKAKRGSPAPKETSNKMLFRFARRTGTHYHNGWKYKFPDRIGTNLRLDLMFPGKFVLVGDVWIPRP